jgi:hypothetical protein
VYFLLWYRAGDEYAFMVIGDNPMVREGLARAVAGRWVGRRYGSVGRTVGCGRFEVRLFGIATHPRIVPLTDLRQVSQGRDGTAQDHALQVGYAGWARLKQHSGWFDEEKAFPLAVECGVLSIQCDVSQGFIVAASLLPSSAG